MKIKYSNKIKELLPTSTLQEIIQLSFSVIPYQSLHIFSFEDFKSGEICITHTMPIANIEKKIVLPQRKIPKENIVLLRTKDVIYIFTENEYTK